MSTIDAAALTPGMHRGVSMADYLAMSAMSASALEEFRRSPAHYRYRLESPPDSTAALDRGEALHAALFEPGLFDGHWLRSIEGDGRRKEVREARAAQIADNPDAQIIPAVDFDSVIGMRDSVLAHPRAKTLLNGYGEIEVTGVFEDPDTGVLCKFRPDRVVGRASLNVNLKSARDASPIGFGRAAANLGYHRREAFYRRGLRAVGVECRGSAIVAVEPDPPYAVACYLWDEEDLNAAEREVIRLLRYYATCERDNHWPAYGEEFLSLRLPKWATEAEGE